MGLKARPARGESKHPYLFVGAGNAGYFEWADIYVYFNNVPSPAAKAAIAKRFPKPLADSVEWDGQIVYASSGQFVNLAISQSYVSTDGEPEPNDFLGALPTTSQMDAFERDVVEWLDEAHDHSPIAFALRREDFEAGGTEFDAWHDASAAQIPELVLPKLAKHLTQKPRSSTGSYLLAYAIEMVPKADRKRVPANFIRWDKD